MAPNHQADHFWSHLGQILPPVLHRDHIGRPQRDEKGAALPQGAQGVAWRFLHLFPKKGMFDVLPMKKYGVSICVFRKRCGVSGVDRFHLFNICYFHSFLWENGNGGYNRISCDIPEDIEAIQYLGTSTTGFGVSHFHTNLVLGWRNKNGKSTPPISTNQFWTDSITQSDEASIWRACIDFWYSLEIWDFPKHGSSLAQDKGTLSEPNLWRMTGDSRKICNIP